MGLRYLIAVEKWSCLLSLILLAGGMIFAGQRAAFSIAVGAGLMTLNAVLVRRVAQRLGGVLQKRPSLTVLLFNLKLGVLIALIFVAFRYLHVEPIAFMVGISVMPISILIVAVLQGLARPNDAESEKPNG